MKAGKAITLVAGSGDRRGAICAKVRDDVTPTGHKVLDVTIGAELVEAVPYVADRVEGEAYWQLTTDPVLED